MRKSLLIYDKGEKTMIVQPNDGKPLTDGFNFTPIYKGERVRMRAKFDGAIRERKRGFQGMVTDLDSGKRYRVYGRDCGLQCYCDAEIKNDRKQMDRLRINGAISHLFS
jgi:hypothetical protein